MQSRRASPRIPYDEAVCLTRVDGNGRLYGRGVDLGTGGMGLMCTESCSIDTDVRCDLLLPGGPRAVAGRVVRVAAAPVGFELAIVFVDLKPGVVAVIEEMVNAALVPDDAAASSGAIDKAAVDQPSGDGVPRVALEVGPANAQHEQTQRYGTPRATPPQPMKPPPSSLPPACGKPLPSVVLAPDVAAATEQPTPLPVLSAAPPPAPPPAPKRRADGPKRAAAPVMRGTAVVARRNEPPAWAWQPPAVVVVTPAPLVAPPARRPSLLDAPLSARSLMVLAPLLALVVALVVQLSR
jgi:hypothetical protein